MTTPAAFDSAQAIIDRFRSYTFMGLLDDEVERYPFAANIDADYIYASLLKSVFFSGPLLILDGFLLQHHLCREAIFGSGSHPLRVLIDEGYLGIVSIEQDLEASLRKRAESGVTSIKAALDSFDRDQVRRVLRGLARQLSDRKQIYSWPQKDTGQGLWEVVRLCRGKPSADLGLNHIPDDALLRIFDRFEARMATSTEAARTTWKDIALNEIKASVRSSDQVLALREAMNFINEANHFNFATCLSPLFENPIAVETQHSSNFEDLVNVQDVELSKAVKMPVCPTPRIDLRTQGAILKEFILESYELHSIKRQFLAQQDAYLANQLDYAQLENTRDEYAQKIAERFGPYSDVTRAQAKLGWFSLAGTNAVRAAADLSSLSALAMGAIALMTQQRAAPIVIRKLRQRVMTKDLRAYMDKVILAELRASARQPKPVVSVELRQAQVKRIVETLANYS